jgi:hypothetical protein
MSELEYFEQECGPAVSCQPASQEAIEQYADRLPGILIDHWKEQGWCGYVKGLLWLVNPQDFEDAVEDWVAEQDRPAVVFARTAFGDLFVWANNQVYFLSVHHGWFEDITDDMEIFFNGILCDKQYLDKGLRGKLFRKALPKLGAPEPDECYAFVPALALGGSEDAGSLQRVKLREHLAVLAQLQ